jgi:hypothetical protein
MPATTITAFPIIGKNPIDTPITEATISNYTETDLCIVGVIKSSSTPCIFETGAFYAILEKKGWIRVFNITETYDSDALAMAAGAKVGNFYVTSNDTNHTSGTLTIRLIE